MPPQISLARPLLALTLPLLLGLAAAACLSESSFADGAAIDGGQTDGPSQGVDVLDVEMTPLGCAPAGLDKLPSPYLFWELRWQATPQWLDVDLYNTFGGTCGSLIGGATYDPAAGRLALFYDAPEGDPGCAEATRLCGDRQATHVRLRLPAAGLGLADVPLVDVTRGRRAPDYANVLFVDQRFCTSSDSGHTVAALESVELADAPAGDVVLALHVQTPGPADCYGLGYHSVHFPERTILWPHASKLAERCPCGGAAEWTTFTASVSMNPVGRRPIYVLGRDPASDGFHVLGLAP